jgi:putative CocE/NonD family hydrolase
MRRIFSLSIFLLMACAVLSGAAAVARAQEPQKNQKTFQPDEATLAGLDGQYEYTDAPQATFEAFYLGEPGTVFSLTHENGEEYVEGPRTPRAELHFDAPDDLVLPEIGIHYLIQRDAAGSVIGWKRIGDSAEQIAKKISSTPVHYSFPTYERSEAMIPARDGVKLHVVILRPKGSEQPDSRPLPILMERTPYGVDNWNSDQLNARYTELAKSGYIFVFADIRGRYGSGGEFVMNRAVVHKFGDRTDPATVDESSDAYDTVEWLVHNVANNNGRVGVMGISYDGFTAMMAGIDPHPAVKAISPQAPMTNTWMGDDFFHNGAFRQSYGYDYILGMESGKKNAFGKLNEDAYDYFLRAGNFSAAAKQGGVAKLPTAKEFISHPEYAEFWRDMAVEALLTAAEMPVLLPTLEVGGWWDQEDLWGPQAEYAALATHDTSHEVRLVLGPWRHGGWGGSTTNLGQVDFGEPTTDEFRARYEAPFFEHYLKDGPALEWKDAATFQTGSNRWMQYDAWPPKKNTAEKNLYLGADGGLSFTAPTNADGYREYVSDSANPVPYRHRPIQATYAPGSQWYAWMAEDQRFVTSRPDVTTWTTSPLDHDVTVTGEVVADIFAATTGSDADWVVKLIDVYPEDTAGAMAGFELMVNGEIFRGRYRKSFEHAEAITPNVVNEYSWSLHAADHVFLKGHRIMVEVQSSWFPLYDRNPQTFVKNIMTAKPDAYKEETERIYCSPQYPSRIELPIAEAK